MVELSENKFDYVMVIRPDSMFTNPLDKTIFSVLDEDPQNIIIPKFDSNEGYNDRFAVLNNETCRQYCCRINEIYDWRKNHTKRIVSEKFVKYIVKKYYKINKTNILFRLIRP